MSATQPTEDFTLVAAHDAGGAEVVSAWVARQTQGRFRFVLAGPARDIFRRRLGPEIAVSPEVIESWFPAATRVLTASSYGANLERRVLLEAKAHGIPTATCLDHWVNYRARFEHDGHLVLPDELWVVDQAAYLVAREAFPGVPLRLHPNFYLAELIERARVWDVPEVDRHRKNPRRILYVAEPISRVNSHLRGDPRIDGYDEFDALRLFLSWAARLAVAASPLALRLRPHPAEPRDKYHPLLAEFGGLAVDSTTSASLLEECAWADAVCGCSSMAMFIAHALGREVLCAIPPAGGASLLPLPALRYLRDEIQA